MAPPGISSAATGASLPAHTPGPWMVSAGGDYVVTNASGLPHGRTHGYGCGSDHIASLNDGEYHEYANGQEQMANARLIAAAPELLEALLLALPTLEALASEASDDLGAMHQEGGRPGEAMLAAARTTFAQADAAQQAIAKALGADPKDGTADPLSRSGRTPK